MIILLEGLASWMPLNKEIVFKKKLGTMPYWAEYNDLKGIIIINQREEKLMKS